MGLPQTKNQKSKNQKIKNQKSKKRHSLPILVQGMPVVQ
jgi:hypothetical protein